MANLYFGLSTLNGNFLKNGMDTNGCDFLSAIQGLKITAGNIHTYITCVGAGYFKINVESDHKVTGLTLIQFNEKFETRRTKFNAGDVIKISNGLVNVLQTEIKNSEEKTADLQIQINDASPEEVKAAEKLGQTSREIESLKSEFAGVKNEVAELKTGQNDIKSLLAQLLAAAGSGNVATPAATTAATDPANQEIPEGVEDPQDPDEASGS